MLISQSRKPSGEGLILLFTDFGAEGPYLGQMEAVLHQSAPGCVPIKLVSDAPVADPRRGSYLLAALANQFPTNSVFLAVVDPGVGGERLPVVLEADGRWFVGPDNGLLNTAASWAVERKWRVIEWRPQRCSASFHGRDLFAPIAAKLASGDRCWAHREYAGPDLAGWPAAMPEIVYIDRYGNAITGIRYGEYCDGRMLTVHGHRLGQARTFSAVEVGTAFWYCNSMGLVEVAVNQGRAATQLALEIGDPVAWD